MPDPPQQHSAWNAPIGTTVQLVSLTQTMFAHGLPDPRSCEYREVELSVGDVWSGGPTQVQTHAWVVPARGNDQRYAIAWNGLLYPIQQVGAPADLRADLRAAIRADETARQEQQVRAPSSTFYRHLMAQPEASSVHPSALYPLRIVFLLRLGERALAEELLQTWRIGLPPNTNNNNEILRDLYLTVASDWLWSLFDRAVCAHMRGADDAAYEAATIAHRVRPLVEAEAERRGFRRPSSGNDRSYVGFLEPLDRLLADSTRRLNAHACTNTPTDAGVETVPSDVASLIAQLENVRARQWGQPGGVNLAEAPVVAALLRAGEPAVEPLLHVLEQDERLTRSVHFHRDFGRHRSLLGVHEAAYVALSGILRASFFNAGSTGDNLTARGLEGRRAVAAQLRTFWERWRGVSLEERWFRTLADDREEHARWVEAAGSLITPTNVEVQPGSSVFVSTITTPLPAGQTPRMRGESLRSRSNPSVTALLAQRVDALLPLEENTHPPPELYVAANLARALARWDPQGGLPTLQRTSTRLLRYLREGNSSDIFLARVLRDIAAARKEQRDPTALNEYLAFLEHATPQDLFGFLPAAMQPLWQNPEDPAVLHTTELLFGRLRERWAQVPPERYHWNVFDLAHTPFLRVRPYRQFVLRLLSDRHIVGTTRITGANSYELSVGTGSNHRGVRPDETLPPVGTSIPLRLCDLIAASLEQTNAPAYRAFWSEAQRNTAITALQAFVERTGALRTPTTDEDN